MQGVTDGYTQTVGSRLSVRTRKIAPFPFWASANPVNSLWKAHSHHLPPSKVLLVFQRPIQIALPSGHPQRKSSLPIQVPQLPAPSSQWSACNSHHIPADRAAPVHTAALSYWKHKLFNGWEHFWRFSLLPSARYSPAHTEAVQERYGPDSAAHAYDFQRYMLRPDHHIQRCPLRFWHNWVWKPWPSWEGWMGKRVGARRENKWTVDPSRSRSKRGTLSETLTGNILTWWLLRQWWKDVRESSVKLRVSLLSHH